MDPPAFSAHKVATIVILGLSVFAWITAILLEHHIPQKHLNSSSADLIHVLWLLSALSSTVFFIYYALRPDTLQHCAPRISPVPLLITFIGISPLVTIFLPLFG